jgi:hypothetical protein
MLQLGAACDTVLDQVEFENVTVSDFFTCECGGALNNGGLEITLDCELIKSLCLPGVEGY